MARIDLPEETKADGSTVKHWADIRDAKTLKQRDRRKILMLMDSDAGAMTKSLDMVAGLLAMLIENWSFEDLPLPSKDLNSLEELPIPTWDALAGEARVAQALIFGSDLGDEKDPDSPSKPSTA